jgi:hypothetical protein
MKANSNTPSVKSTTLARKTLPLGLLLSVGLFLSACQQEAKDVKAVKSDPTGIYTLVTVNGNQLPATVAHEGVSLQVRSGSFTMNADGTCGSKMTFVPPGGHEATVEVSATYTREGAKLNMQWKNAGTTTGTLEGTTFTMENEGMMFAYKK